MLIFGGRGSSSFLNDVWEFDLGAKHLFTMQHLINGLKLIHQDKFQKPDF